MYFPTFKYFIIAPILVLSLYTGNANSCPAQISINDQLSPIISDESVNARLIVSNFLSIVDDGQIKLFGVVLSRDMILPIKVSHEYLITKDAFNVVIYATLTRPINLPEFETLIVKGITVSFTEMGEISQILAHVEAD